MSLDLRISTDRLHRQNFCMQFPYFMLHPQHQIWKLHAKFLALKMQFMYGDQASMEHDSLIELLMLAVGEFRMCAGCSPSADLALQADKNIYGMPYFHK